MHLAVFLICVIFGTGLAIQLANVTIPAGTPRHIILLAIAAAAGVLIFQRIGLAATQEPTTPPTTLQQMSL